MITISAQKELIEWARQRAQADHTTLNAEFRRWLAQNAEGSQTEVDLSELIERLSYAQPKNTITRDERMSAKYFFDNPMKLEVTHP